VTDTMENAWKVTNHQIP